MLTSLVFWGLGLIFAPLLLGAVQRVKAVFAGRRGAPLTQQYYDLRKLLGKGAVYSRTSTFVFRTGPVVGLAGVLVAGLLVPVGGVAAPLAFQGDLILLVYLLGLVRLFTVLAALDTGSSFEGMGASREVWLSVLTEPAIFLALAALTRETGAWSLSAMMAGVSGGVWYRSAAVLLPMAAALFIVTLAENARIPVDDPATHLELTMIHEVMVLDHGGVDMAFIIYTAALKLWLMGTLLVDLLLPVRTGSAWLDGLCGLAGMGLVAAVIGAVESSMARLRFKRVPQLLLGAVAFAAVALILSLGGRQ